MTGHGIASAQQDRGRAIPPHRPRLRLCHRASLGQIEGSAPEGLSRGGGAGLGPTERASRDTGRLSRDEGRGSRDLGRAW
eukprot:393698-Rhodomonas_salina.5